MHFLIDAFSTNEEATRQKLEICQMLEALMKRFFPDCSAIPYGSSVNRLGMTDSDLDVFLDLKVDFDLDDEQERTFTCLISQLEKYRRRVPGYETFQFLDRVRGLDVRRVIRIVGSIIRRYGAECANVFCIPHARCPIVNFKHRASGSCCDVSLQNGLAIHNTILVRFYQNLDVRVRPLLFFIRFWAKQMRLVDSKRNRFSSYAITMLTLFYLQNCSPPVLPTVEELQRTEDKKTMCFGWDCTFCRDESKIRKSANASDLETLLVGFFEYYARVILTRDVLCLRTGEGMSPSQFKEHIKADERLGDFKMSIINIQDAFELNFNIARGVNEDGALEWNQCIGQARYISTTKELWARRTDNRAWGLVSLLLDVSCNNQKPKPRKRKGASITLPKKALRHVPGSSASTPIRPSTSTANNAVHGPASKKFKSV